MIQRDTNMFHCDLPQHKSTSFRLPTPRSISSLPKLKKNYPSSVSSQADCKSTTKSSEHAPTSLNSDTPGNTHWECCRIVNLRIPLPSGSGVSPHSGKGQTATGPSNSEWYPNQRRLSCGDNSLEKVRKISTPKLSELLIDHFRRAEICDLCSFALLHSRPVSPACVSCLCCVQFYRTFATLY